jgi:hypothetical protein
MAERVIKRRAPMSERTKEKIREKALGRERTLQHNLNVATAMYGRKDTDEVKEHKTMAQRKRRMQENCYMCVRYD